MVEPACTESGGDPRRRPLALDEIELPSVGAVELLDGQSLVNMLALLVLDSRDVAVLSLMMGPNSA